MHSLISIVRLKMRNIKSVRIDFTNREALELFLEDHDHIALRNHTLTGKHAGIRSVDVTDDWRALYREEPERIIFVELGTHDELYGKES